MPAGFRVASAYVDIHAEDAGLRGEIKRAIEGAVAGENGKVKLNVDTAGLRSKVSAAVNAAGTNQKVKVGVNIDTAGLRAKVSAAMAAAGANQKVKVQTNLDTAGLRSKVSAAISAAGTGQKVKVGLKLDTAGFRAAVSAAVAAAGVGQYVHVGAKVDTAGLRAGVSAAVAEAGVGQRVHVGVDVDRGSFSRAEGAMRTLSRDAGRTFGGGSNGRSLFSKRTGIGGLSVGTIAAGLSMLEPVLGALIAPAKALGIASAAIVPAFLGTAVAATALIVGSKGVSKAMKASNKDAVDYGKGLNNLAPSAQEFVKATSNMGGAFDQMRLSTQQALFAGLGNEVTKLGRQALPVMTAGLAGMAGVMNTAFKGVTGTLDKLAGNGQLAQMFGGIQTAFKPLAAIPGQFVQMLTQIGAAASPLLTRITTGIAGGMTKLTDKIDQAFTSGRLEGSIDRAGESIHKFFTNFRDNGAVQEFMQNMKQMGPQAAQSLQKIGEAGLHLLNNASPIGAALLKVGGAAAGIVNAIPSSALSNMMLFAGGLSLIGKVSPALSAGLPRVATAIGSIGRSVEAGGLATVGGKIRSLGNSLLFLGGANRVATPSAAGLRSIGSGATLAGVGAAAATPKIGALNAGLILLGAGVIGSSLMEWSAGLGQKAIPTVGKMTSQLMGLTASGKLQTEGLKGLSQGWLSIGKAMENIISPSASQRVANVLEMGDGKNSDLNRSRAMVKNLDQSLADMVGKGYGPQAAQIFEKIKDAAGAQGLNVKQATAEYKKYNQAVKDQAVAEKVAAMTMGTFGKAAIATQKVLNQNSGEVKGLQNSYNGLGRFQASVTASQLGYNQAVTQAEGLLKKHSNALSMQGGMLNTVKPKAQAAATAMLNVAEAARKTGEAFSGKGDFAARLKTYDDARSKIMALGRAQGLTAAQSREFANQILPVDRLNLAKSAVAQTAKEMGTLTAAMATAAQKGGMQKIFNFNPNSFTSQARLGLDALKGVVTKTLDNGNIQVKVDTATAKRQVTELSDVMASLKSKGTQTIKVPTQDISAMTTAAKAMGMSIKNLGGGKIKITAQDGASVIIQGVKSKLDGIKDKKVKLTIDTGSGSIKGADTFVGKSIAALAKETGDPIRKYASALKSAADPNTADAIRRQAAHFAEAGKNAGTASGKAKDYGDTVKKILNDPRLQARGRSASGLGGAVGPSDTEASKLQTFSQAMGKLAAGGKSVQVAVSITGTEQIEKLTALNAVKNKSINVQVNISGTEQIDKLKALNAVNNKSINVQVNISGTEQIDKLKALNAVDNKFIQVQVSISGTEQIDKLKALNEVNNKSIQVSVAISGTEQIDKLKALNEVNNKSIQVSVAISGTEQIEKLKTLNQVNNKSIIVNVSVTGTEQIAKLKELNNVNNKNISVTVNISGAADIPKLKELNNVQSKSISVTVSVSGAGTISTLKSNIAAVKSKTVTVTVSANAGPINTVKSAIAAVKGKSVTVTASANAGPVRALTAAINAVHAKSVTVTANVNGTGAVNALVAAIAAVQSKTVTVTVNTVHTGSAAGGGYMSNRLPGFAHGGRSMIGGGNVNGIGTATSDSILARLSNGEFVIRASMVKKYGPEMLAAINHGAFNTSASHIFANGALKRFAAGGSVGGYSTGGSVSGGGDDTWTYIIKWGDTLSEIAADFHTTVAILANLNNISNPDMIYAGSKLKIPGSDYKGMTNAITSYTNYTIRWGDTLTSIARKFGTSVDALVKLNSIRNPDLIYAGANLKIPMGGINIPKPPTGVLGGTKPGDWNYLAPPHFSKLAYNKEDSSEEGKKPKDVDSSSLTELVDGFHHVYSNTYTGTNSSDLVNKVSESTDVKGLADSLDQMRSDLYTVFAPGTSRNNFTLYLDQGAQILFKYGKNLETVNKSLEDAKKTQDELNSNYKSLVDTIGQAVEAFGTIVKTGKSGASTETMLRQLTTDAGATTRFSQGLSALNTRGLNSTTLGQIAAAGPVDGLRTIQSLLQASPEQLSQLNLLQKQIDTAANQAGKTAAESMYGAGIAASKGLVDGLLAQKTQIEDAMKIIAQAMKEAIREALGIASPSRVMHGYGINIIEGLTRGMVAEGRSVPEIVRSIVDQIVFSRKDGTLSSHATSNSGTITSTPSGISGDLHIGNIHLTINCDSGTDLSNPEEAEKVASQLVNVMMDKIREENRKRK